MAGISTATAVALIELAIVAGGTAYSIASAPGTPEVPKAPAPPPPPPGVQPPAKKAPTPAAADTGVATARKERQRAFGLEQTLLATPKLGITGGTTGTGAKLGRGSLL